MNDLYRIDPKAHDAYDGSYTGGLPDPISFLVDDGVLVLVKPEGTIKWCFVHLAAQFSWTEDGGVGCLAGNHLRGNCDIGIAVIVRAE